MRAGRKYSNYVIYRRLFAEARPFWGHIAGLFAVSLAAMPLTLLNPVPLKLVVDSVLGTHPLPRLFATLLPSGVERTSVTAIAFIATLSLLIALGRQLSDLTFSLFRTYTAEKLVLAFRAKLLRQVQGLSLAYHDSQGTAESPYRIPYDAPAIQWIAL